MLLKNLIFFRLWSLLRASWGKKLSSSRNLLKTETLKCTYKCFFLKGGMKKGEKKPANILKNVGPVVSGEVTHQSHQCFHHGSVAPSVVQHLAL